MSQCLNAGGLTQNSTWHYYTSSHQYTNAWSVANDLKNYLKNNVGAPILAPKWKKTAIPSQRTYAYVNDSSNITSSDGGRVVVFYDWKDDGIIDHASIIVATGNAEDNTGYGDLIDQNSTDRKHVIWHLDHYNTHKNTTAIYAFRIP